MPVDTPSTRAGGGFLSRKPAPTSLPRPAPSLQASEDIDGEDSHMLATAAMCCLQLRRTVDDTLDMDKLSVVRHERRLPDE